MLRRSWNCHVKAEKNQETNRRSASNSRFSSQGRPSFTNLLNRLQPDQRGLCQFGLAPTGYSVAGKDKHHLTKALYSKEHRGVLWGHKESHLISRKDETAHRKVLRWEAWDSFPPNANKSWELTSEMGWALPPDRVRNHTERCIFFSPEPVGGSSGF